MKNINQSKHELINKNKRALGTEYEIIARDYLKKHGYIILAINYRCKCGEIDIIALNDGIICFIEVKYRRSAFSGMPFEAVDYKKQHRIINVAQFYLMTTKQEDAMCRFDVVSILGNDISLIKNAFEL